ncbi:MAG: riboflavin biosynthesis protein RibF [Bacteroidetes bacterium]|nr:riboflavin biosynthesis protein RibF [Bacteroidota bacterium]
MKIHRDIENLPSFRNAVITIGTFDGVHMGHRQIINNLKAEAAAINGETVILTFHPHPRKVIASTILGVRLINTLEERLELLEQCGIDHVVVVPFTDAFANQPAQDYIKDFLIAKFHPHTIIIGYDHRFGRERKGDYLLLENKASEYGYVLKEIPKHVLDEISISSTKIREALLEGNIEIADRLLGYEFFFSGTVVHGDKLGRKLGYPTANLKIPDEEKISPGNGIYAVYAQPEGYDERLKGMMSIGFRPTVDGKKRVIEVNIFDFNKEIYDQSLKVYVKKYLRAELKFNSLEELVSQIGQDKIESLKVL